MANITDLVSTYQYGAGDISTGLKNQVRSNYIALAILNAGALPAVGSTYTNDADGGIGENIPVDGQHLASICKDLYLFNKGRWFPDGTVNGSKEDTTNMMQGVVYGSDPFDTPTGEITDLAHFVFKNYHQNVAGINVLRSNPTAYDFVIFTEYTAIVVTRSANSAIIASIVSNVAGSNDSTMSGTINLGWRGIDGEIEPLSGVYKSDLVPVGFTISEGTLTNLTAGTCNGKYKLYTRTTPSTVSSIGMTPNIAGPCASFSLFRLVGTQFQPATGATYASINTSTGLVTFPANHAAGATKYMVVYRNEVGAYGTYYLQVNI